MKIAKVLGIVLATLFAATGASAQSSVDISQAISGSFGISALDEHGVAVHNGGDTDLLVQFCPTGRWSFHGDENFVPACGTGFDRADRLRFPNLNLAQLAITRDGARGGKVDADDRFSIEAGETVYLLMNDVPGQYSDNQGALQIMYTSWPQL